MIQQSRPTPLRSLECWTVIGGDTREAVFHVSDYSVLVDPTVKPNQKIKIFITLVSSNSLCVEVFYPHIVVLDVY